MSGGDNDISINVSSEPQEKFNTQKGKRKKFVERDTADSPKKFERKESEDDNEQRKRRKKVHKSNEEGGYDDEGENADAEKKKGPPKLVISSLFHSNPEIPHMEDSRVDPVKEKLFSSKLFNDLPLHEHMLANLKKEMGLDNLTTVQRKSIPVIMSGKDALVKSQTGSGKTLAYAVPIIQALQEIRPKISRSEGVFAVIIVPTRELAVQTYEWFIKLVKSFTWIVAGCLMGGEKRKSEKARLRKGVNVLVATPGRLLDHVIRTKSLHLDKVRYLVLDEADRLLDMGYEKDVASIIESLGDIERQTILLSATLTPGVARLAGMSLTDPAVIHAASHKGNPFDTDGAEGNAALVTPKSLQHYYTIVPAKLRLVTLAAIIVDKCQFSAQRKILIFCATQDVVDFLTALLSQVLAGQNGDSARERTSSAIYQDDYNVNEYEEPESSPIGNVDVEFLKLHGNMTQKDRLDVFQTFRKADSGVLVCTDVGSRGLDLPHVDWIVQLSSPPTPEDYVHRAGRTARINAAGNSLIFLLPSEVGFVDVLQKKRISLQELAVEKCLQSLLLQAPHEISGRGRNGPTVESVATSLQMRFESAVHGDSQMHDLACKAYTSYIRFYASYPRECRDVFNFKNVHLGHHAKSFALRDAPSAIGGIGRRQWLAQKDMHKRDRGVVRKRRVPGKISRTKLLELSEFASGLVTKKKKEKE